MCEMSNYQSGEPGAVPGASTTPTAENPSGSATATEQRSVESANGVQVSAAGIAIPGVPGVWLEGDRAWARGLMNEPWKEATFRGVQQEGAPPLVKIEIDGRIALYGFGTYGVLWKEWTAGAPAAEKHHWPLQLGQWLRFFDCLEIAEVVATGNGQELEDSAVVRFRGGPERLRPISRLGEGTVWEVLPQDQWPKPEKRKRGRPRRSSAEPPPAPPAPPALTASSDVPPAPEPVVAPDWARLQVAQNLRQTFGKNGRRELAAIPESSEQPNDRAGQLAVGRSIGRRVMSDFQRSVLDELYEGLWEQLAENPDLDPLTVAACKYVRDDERRERRG